MNTYAWTARERIKKALSVIAGTCLFVFTSDAAYKAILDVTLISDRLLRVIGIVGIVAGVLGASPIGRLFFKDEDAPK